MMGWEMHLALIIAELVLSQGLLLTLELFWGGEGHCSHLSMSRNVPIIETSLKLNVFISFKRTYKDGSGGSS